MTEKMDDIEPDKDVKTNKKTAIMVCSILVLLLLVSGGYRYYKSRKTTNSGNNSTAQSQDNGAPNTDSNNPDTNDVNSIDSEIQNNPNDPNLYVQKSNTLYNSGDKAGALDAVNDGLINNPDSEILKSKKDVLEKDYFQSSDQTAPRQ